MEDLRGILSLGALEAAPKLLGCVLSHSTPKGTIAGQIIEVEAYTQNDAASHSFNGQTKRNSAMFASPGTCYIYFTYGLHYCLNVVAGQVGQGEAILIRALKPTKGLELMWQNRYHAPLPTSPSPQNITSLADGPAKLVQAFGLDLSYNGIDLLTKRNLKLWPNPTLNHKFKIKNTPRIGIKKVTEKLWRWKMVD